MVSVLVSGTSPDKRLVEIALRNTRNAARLVQSLGDLAKLDEPEFKLHAEVVDADELLDDIGMRFAERAAQQGVVLRADHPADSTIAAPAFAAIDIEVTGIAPRVLFEHRAVSLDRLLGFGVLRAGFAVFHMTKSKPGRHADPTKPCGTSRSVAPIAMPQTKAAIRPLPIVTSARPKANRAMPTA